MSDYQYDLVIIGAGPGGYEAAFYAQEFGMKVAIVEKDKVGGTCLNRGCIPTKALMHSSDVYRDAAHGAAVGVEVDGLHANRKRIGERKDEVLDTLRTGISGLLKKKKIDVLKGTGVIIEPHTVSVTSEQGGNVIVRAKNIMVATGSKPFMPPIPGSDLPCYFFFFFFRHRIRYDLCRSRRSCYCHRGNGQTSSSHRQGDRPQHQDDNGEEGR